MGDLVLVQAFANDPEAQVAAAALRNAGLHPVVLAHDPLAQLLDPGRGARLLVPEEEAGAARETLGLGPLGERSGEGISFRALAATVVAVIFGLAAYTAPRLLPRLVVATRGRRMCLRPARTAK